MKLMIKKQTGSKSDYAESHFALSAYKYKNIFKLSVFIENKIRC
jgi:hypothetical protein